MLHVVHEVILIIELDYYKLFKLSRAFKSLFPKFVLPKKIICRA